MFRVGRNSRGPIRTRGGSPCSRTTTLSVAGVFDLVNGAACSESCHCCITQIIWTKRIQVGVLRISAREGPTVDVSGFALCVARWKRGSKSFAGGKGRGWPEGDDCAASMWPTRGYGIRTVRSKNWFGTKSLAWIQIGHVVAVNAQKIGWASGGCNPNSP
jgi:hypothetical protein